MADYFLGLDLGQRCDHTAVAILETGVDPGCYHLRYLERLKLNTHYTAVVNRVGELVRVTQLLGRCTVVGDATGVELPVLELLRQNHCISAVQNDGRHLCYDGQDPYESETAKTFLRNDVEAIDYTDPISTARLENQWWGIQRNRGYSLNFDLDQTIARANTITARPSGKFSGRVLGSPHKTGRLFTTLGCFAKSQDWTPSLFSLPLVLSRP
jgi:hypothetical protein